MQKNEIGEKSGAGRAKSSQVGRTPRMSGWGIPDDWAEVQQTLAGSAVCDRVRTGGDAAAV